MNDITFEDKFVSLLMVHSDHSSFARYLEPHLPLIKSKNLTEFYYALRYHKATYLEYVPLLIYDSITDYRLRRVLEQSIEFLNRPLIS